MKYEKVITFISCLLVIIAAILKVFHLPYANYSTLIISVGTITILYVYYTKAQQLKKQVKDLSK